MLVRNNMNLFCSVLILACVCAHTVQAAIGKSLYETNNVTTQPDCMTLWSKYQARKLFFTLVVLFF